MSYHKRRPGCPLVLPGAVGEDTHAGVRIKETGLGPRVEGFEPPSNHRSGDSLRVRIFQRRMRNEGVFIEMLCDICFRHYCSANQGDFGTSAGFAVLCAFAPLRWVLEGVRPNTQRKGAKDRKAR